MNIEDYQPLSRLRSSAAAQVCLAASALVLIGALTPWLHFQSCQNVGSIQSLGLDVLPTSTEDVYGFSSCSGDRASYPPTSISGLDLGATGVLVLFLALAAAGAAAAYASRLPDPHTYRYAGIVASAAGVLVVLLTGLKVADTANLHAVSIKVSWGTWLTCISGLIVALSGVVMLRRAGSQASETTDLGEA